MLSVWCCLVFFYWPAIDLLTVCLLPGEFLQAALSMMDLMGKTDMAWRTFKTVSQNQSHAASWSNWALWERPLLWRVHLWGFIAFDIFWSFYFFYLLMSVQISHADYPRVLHCKFPTRYHCTWRRKTLPSLNCLHRIAILMFGLISDLFLSLRIKSGNRRRGGSRLLVMDFLHGQQVRHKY